VPPGSAAITLGRVILMRSDAPEQPYLLRHELVHVRQWRRHGVVGFLVRYLGPYVVWRIRRKGHWGAYRRIPFEIEADWFARRLMVADERPADLGHPAAPR
jgi:hypothetical protein